MTNNNPSADSKPQVLQEPLSPGQLAWQRLKRNKLAMFGLYTVLLFHILCFGAPLFTSQNASRHRPWIGSLPPGSQSNACFQENTFSIGSAPQLNDYAADARTITLNCTELLATEYRITIYRSGRRKGLIKQIQEKSGALRMQSIDLSEGSIVNVDNENLPVPNAIYTVGEAAPNNAFTEDSGSVIQIKHFNPQQSLHYTLAVTLENGIVQSIQKDGAALNKTRIYGEHIHSVQLDGQACTHLHILGTDTLGRDMWSRILYGGRISLLVGIIATLVSLIIGVFYGAIAGYQGGRTDRVMMSAVDVLYAIPFMFIVILLLVVLGKNIFILFAALGAVQWLTTARIVRGQVLSLKSREFIEAAQVNGASTWCIITRHLLPNAIGPIIVYATLTVPAVILEESFLAFLGLQVEWGEVPLDSWGYLVNTGRLSMNYQTWDQWWLLICPAGAMILTLLGLNTLGDGLRDALDPQDNGNDR